MQHPTFRYLVTRQDESVVNGFGRTHISTLGHAASTFDAYRIVAIDSVIDKPDSWCLTDTDAAAALGRIIDGPISSHLDIERAESAVRAVLLHDYVQVLVPCAKGEQSNGFVHYIRLDKSQRNEAAFSALEVAPCRDLLFAIEYLKIAGGAVASSSNQSSSVVGVPVEQLDLHYRSFLKNASELATAFPVEVGASTYYSSEGLGKAMRNGAKGFVDELYRRVYRPWMEMAQAAPSLCIDVRLPPLLAIVLSRAPSREKIPETLRELRDDLHPVREDLSNLNIMLDKTMSQADIHAQIRRVNESFDAIVPEALLTDGERRYRRIISVFNFIKPVRQLYSIAVDPLAIDQEKMFELFGSIKSAVATDSRIVSRSVSAAKLSELLRVDSVRGIVQTQFSASEVAIISKGIN